MTVLIVMGVCGSGKSTVGSEIASRLSCGFADADDFHSAANKTKMSQGIPLTDSDRLPWLQSIYEYIKRCSESQEDTVIACSALKKSYRNILRTGSREDLSNNHGIIFVYLQGSYDIFAKYLDSRKGHFMSPTLLKSQLETLEEPQLDEKRIIVDASLKVDGICNFVMNELSKDKSAL